MAKIIIESVVCDQGHYGHTIYYCSECMGDCKDSTKNVCPKCGVIFDEKIEYTINSGFGGSDF